MAVTDITKGKLNELIQKKAFELYIKRGRVPGNEWVDWFEAEKIVNAELKKSKRR
jgi:hypothetical protein